jgi:spoIIIJ-associated protein
MTSGLEFDGKNVEIAIKKACDKLKIKEEKLKYDVISYGSTGIFGLVGTKKAKIRVTSPKHLKTLIHEESDNFH